MVQQQSGAVPGHAPVLRSVVYLGGAALLVEGIGYVTQIEELRTFHVLVAPFATAWTACFLAADQRTWRALLGARGPTTLLQGFGLGTAAFLSVAGIAAACGWLHVSIERGHDVARADQAISVLWTTFAHSMVAWNEELVFRGYGLDALIQALGPVPASIGSTVLFALFHTWQPQVLIGEAALGSALLMLRLSSETVWLPLGYHWAWNFMQTAVLGPADGPPSLLPIRVDGPYAWVGRPGYPEPGRLMLLVHLLVAVVVGVRWWRRHNVVP